MPRRALQRGAAEDGGGSRRLRAHADGNRAAAGGGQALKPSPKTVPAGLGMRGGSSGAAATWKQPSAGASSPLLRAVVPGSAPSAKREEPPPHSTRLGPSKTPLYKAAPRPSHPPPIK